MIGNVRIGLWRGARGTSEMNSPNTGGDGMDRLVAVDPFFHQALERPSYRSLIAERGLILRR